MFKNKNKIFKKLMILIIVITFVISAIQLDAQNNKKTDIENKQITINNSNIKLERQTIKTTAEKQSFSNLNIISGIDDEVFVSTDYVGHPAVTSNGEGNAIFFIEHQNEDDPLIREIIAASSYDNGLTWDFESGAYFPNFNSYNKLPALDFRSGLTAYGSWVMVEPNGITPMARLEDMSNPEGGDGWVFWAPDWSDNFEEIGPFYSTDIACYDGPLNEEPDVFWGVTSWTGKLKDSRYLVDFDNGLFLSYFTGEYITISWFPDIEGVYNIVSDIDQSNGMMYWAYEVYNSKTKVNDLWLMLITMEDWFNDESFSIWQIEGPCVNPAIMTENGVLCVAFESEGDIICAYSLDNAETIEISTIAESEYNELYPDITGNGLEAICAFNKNNDLYIAKTTDGGDTWEVDGTSINDISGSVANEPHCINLLPHRIFWTDTRNEVEAVYADYLVPPPEIPTISGPPNGKRNIEYDFNLITTHPAGLDVYYLIDWGDNSISGWLGPYPSGTEITASHTWLTRQAFTIKARVKDENDIYSNWAEYKFSTPRNKIYYQINPLLDRFLQCFPLFEKILKQIQL